MQESNPVNITDFYGNVLEQVANDGEADLLISLIAKVESSRPSTTTSTSTTTTQSTSTGTSTTVKYEESKKDKGQLFRTVSDKCHQRFSSGSSSDDPLTKKPKSSQEGQNRYQMKTQGQYYGYKLNNGDLNQPLFPEKQESTFMKILKGFLQQFGGGSILHDELRHR